MMLHDIILDTGTVARVACLRRGEGDWHVLKKPGTQSVCGIETWSKTLWTLDTIIHFGEWSVWVDCATCRAVLGDTTPIQNLVDHAGVSHAVSPALWLRLNTGSVVEVTTHKHLPCLQTLLEPWQEEQLSRGNVRPVDCLTCLVLAGPS